MTGGIATGKSTAAAIFEKLGAYILDFDVLSREIVEPGKPGLEAVQKAFGNAVITSGGYLDRKKLSDIVFRNPVKLKLLESITHPLINDAFTEKLANIRKTCNEPVVMAVIPLLIEVNMMDLFEKIILVYAPREVQLVRLMNRDDITEEKAGAILDSQLSIEKKRPYADFIVDNRGTTEKLYAEVENVWRAISV